LTFSSDIGKSIVKFDEKGDGPARYTIYNYQKNLADNTFDYKVRCALLVYAVCRIIELGVCTCFFLL
jgi:hypothetical protein